MKILFLYTEIAGYTISCIKEYLRLNYNDEIYLIRYPVNKEAPFQFQISDKIKLYERNKYTDKQLLALVDSINPQAIICSGWVDKGYLKVCKALKKKSITVLTLDNHWRGDIKQHIASLISPFYLHKRFWKCWVPGILQYEYALKLGFKEENIFTGFYSANVNLFHKYYQNCKKRKEKTIPHRFIFVGRYYEFKGIKDLWDAFIELQTEFPNDWELWCLGTGDIKPVQHNKIKHFGFIQPKELEKYIGETGVFVLPSHFEPWGVVVHEFASAGFPLICSNEVGAASTFLINSYNGYSFPSGEINVLKAVLKKIIQHRDEELIVMGERSVEKAMQITPEKWADTLISIMKSDVRH